MKILIVEDNPDDRKLLKFNLEHHGCEVIEASDGEKGLYLASAARPDMIVSDALMPVMDGFQFLRSIKTDETLQSIPFIFYSAVYTGNKEAELAISLGAEAFIVKPQDPQEFWEELLGILKDYKQKKTKTSTAELSGGDEEFLRKYSHVVAAKLEEKVKELETAKAIIEEDGKRYRNLFSSLRDVVIIADMDRRILTANQPALRELFGYEIEEVVGEKTRILYADDSGYNLAGEAIFDSKGFVKGKIIEVNFRKKNNELFYGEIYALKLLDDNGQAIGNIGMIRDITERRRMEEKHRELEIQLQQAQKMESVGRLAGGVAHDYNNILTVIIGYAEMLMDKVGQDDPLYADLHEISEAANRSADITRQLLAFARKQIITPKVLDLNEITEGMLKMLLRLIGEDIRLSWLPGAGLRPVKMDPLQIEQILANLCVNARDAIADVGEIIIETTVVNFDETYCADHQGFIPGDFVLLAVSDDGCGMDRETLDKIFEPFFTTKGVGRGTGLGLATVYGIVSQNNGFIKVYSEPGKGTTFRIYLPRHMGPTVEDRKESTTEIPCGSGETVLVVEDDIPILKLAGTVLERLGYTVLTAGTSGEALLLLETHAGRIDMLMTDVIMPEMNGRDLAERFLVVRPETKCLFMSGYTADIIAHRGVLEEGVKFIQKPFSAMDLAGKVREALEQ